MLVSRCEVLVDKRHSSGTPNSEYTRMGFLTFSLNVTLDGCVDAAPQRRSRDALPARLNNGWQRTVRCAARR
jgi:hypothetical protein